MDSPESLGSPGYAMTRVLIRIDSISTAANASEALYRYAAATGYITVAGERESSAKGNGHGSSILLTKPMTCIH